MSRIHRVSLATALLCICSHAAALSPGEAVDNFRLIDHRGDSHELYYLSDMKAVVLLAHGNGCDAAGQAAAALEALRAKYQPRGVAFLAINSNRLDSRAAILKQAAQAGIKMPILVDGTQLIGESLGLSRNGEVLLLDPRGWKLTYRGGVASGGRNHIAETLDAMLSGGALEPRETQAEGCPINLPELGRRGMHAQISYQKTIAPILIESCVPCHRAGGIGPWQMSGYDMVRGFAPMIREVVRTQRMPPWHADPHHGVFSNDRGLTGEEAKALVHWIEAGSPRGSGADPLTTQPKTWPEWTLGKPDLVVALPKFDVPATGTIPYQVMAVDNPLDHDVWVRAVDFLPGDRSVLHHIIAAVGDAHSPFDEGGGEGGATDRRASAPSASNHEPDIGGTTEASLSNYVPGAQPLQIPPESGILLKKGAKFHFQAHYTPSGKPTHDVTRMGLYFMKEPPRHRYRAAIFANLKLKIPAHAKAHVESDAHTFDRDVLIYSLHPHAHFRGRAASFTAHYPDGREELLLNVPTYDFNWQSTYELSKPKVLPAGTKVVYRTVYDNSAQNKANPDPSRVVPWGQQTWDEMLFGVIRFRYLQEDAALTSQRRETRIDE